MRTLLMNHVPVLIDEVIKILMLQPGEDVIDGTLGCGGHAKRFLKETGPTGRLLGLDLDDEALTASTENLAQFKERVRIVKANFRDIAHIVKKNQDFISKVNVVFFDLGLSSCLIKQKYKGLSFMEEGPLDMRFGALEGSFEKFESRKKSYTLSELRKIRGKKLMAYDLVNFLACKELENLLWEHDVRDARRVARYICESRAKRSIETTQDLVQEVFYKSPRRGKKHPATKTFQALRIVVNDELGSLRKALKDGWDLLAGGGRVAIISYHSLEDRIVKKFFRSCGAQVLTKKPIIPLQKEVLANPRARSAKLRAALKI